MAFDLFASVQPPVQNVPDGHKRDDLIYDQLSSVGEHSTDLAAFSCSDIPGNSFGGTCLPGCNSVP